MNTLYPPFFSLRKLRSLILIYGMVVSNISFSAEVSLDPSDWHLLSYRGIPSHRIFSKEQGMKIEVKRSASPLVALLPQPTVANELMIRAAIDGDLNLHNQAQGTKGADDFRLRVGLIYEGDQALDSFQLALAPSWLKRLARLLPDGTGVSHVQFLNTYSDPILQNLERTHPTTKLWQEKFILDVNQMGKIDQRITVADAAKVIGIWISTDGDDTNSCFDVIIEQISVS